MRRLATIAALALVLAAAGQAGAAGWVELPISPTNPWPRRAVAMGELLKAAQERKNLREPQQPNVFRMGYRVRTNAPSLTTPVPGFTNVAYNYGPWIYVTNEVPMAMYNHQWAGQFHPDAMALYSLDAAIMAVLRTAYPDTPESTEVWVSADDAANLGAYFGTADRTRYFWEPGASPPQWKSRPGYPQTAPAMRTGYYRAVNITPAGKFPFVPDELNVGDGMVEPNERLITDGMPSTNLWLVNVYTQLYTIASGIEGYKEGDVYTANTTKPTAVWEEWREALPMLRPASAVSTNGIIMGLLTIAPYPQNNTAAGQWPDYVYLYGTTNGLLDGKLKLDPTTYDFTGGNKWLTYTHTSGVATVRAYLALTGSTPYWLVGDHAPGGTPGSSGTYWYEPSFYDIGGAGPVVRKGHTEPEQMLLAKPGKAWGGKASLYLAVPTDTNVWHTTLAWVYTDGSPVSVTRTLDDLADGWTPNRYNPGTEPGFISSGTQIIPWQKACAPEWRLTVANTNAGLTTVPFVASNLYYSIYWPPLADWAKTNCRPYVVRTAKPEPWVSVGANGKPAAGSPATSNVVNVLHGGEDPWNNFFNHNPISPGSTRAGLFLVWPVGQYKGLGGPHMGDQIAIVYTNRASLYGWSVGAGDPYPGAPWWGTHPDQLNARYQALNAMRFMSFAHDREARLYQRQGKTFTGCGTMFLASSAPPNCVMPAGCPKLPSLTMVDSGWGPSHLGEMGPDFNGSGEEYLQCWVPYKNGCADWAEACYYMRTFKARDRVYRGQPLQPIYSLNTNALARYMVSANAWRKVNSHHSYMDYAQLTKNTGDAIYRYATSPCGYTDPWVTYDDPKYQAYASSVAVYRTNSLNYLVASTWDEDAKDSHTWNGDAAGDCGCGWLWGAADSCVDWPGTPSCDYSYHSVRMAPVTDDCGNSVAVPGGDCFFIQGVTGPTGLANPNYFRQGQYSHRFMVGLEFDYRD